MDTDVLFGWHSRIKKAIASRSITAQRAHGFSPATVGRGKTMCPAGNKYYILASSLWLMICYLLALVDHIMIHCNESMHRAVSAERHPLWKRTCPELNDSDFIRFGILRCIGAVDSGRHFLQLTQEVHGELWMRYLWRKLRNLLLKLTNVVVSV